MPTGATLAASGGTITTPGMTGSGALVLETGDLTINHSGNSFFDGVVSGTGRLTKTGTGTLTLSDANLYTGTTTVSGGTLRGTRTS